MDLLKEMSSLLTDIASYSQFKTDLSKKERELERFTGDVEKMRKKKRAILAKMGDSAADTVFNAYLSVQASEANRLKRKFQTDRLGSKDLDSSNSGGDEPILNTATASLVDSIKDDATDATKAGGASTSSG